MTQKQPKPPLMVLSAGMTTSTIDGFAWSASILLMLQGVEFIKSRLFGIYFNDAMDSKGSKNDTKPTKTLACRTQHYC